MTAVAGLVAALASLALGAVWVFDRRVANVAAARLAHGDVASTRATQAAVASGGLLVRSSRAETRGAALALGTAVLGWALARQVFGLSPRIALALGFDAALALALVLAVRRERRALLLEAQLASWLRLVASSLRAGMGRVEALGQALAQIGSPLRDVLGEAIGRLRLGEEPAQAFARVAEQVPLESFRLFALVVSAQWHAGGSLQNTVGSIGEALQDRVDVARRIQTQAAPTRSSVLTLVAATAAIAGFSHANDPVNLEHFLSSDWGDGLVASALALQGIALVWIWRLTRTRV